MMITYIFWSFSTIIGFQIVQKIFRAPLFMMMFPFLRHEKFVCWTQITLIFCFWLSKSSFFTTIILLALISVPLFFEKHLFQFWIRYQIQKNIVGFIDLILIRTRSGIGIRASISKTGETSHPFFKKMAEAVVENLDLSPFEIAPFKWFPSELSRVQSSSGKAIDQLLSIKRLVKVLLRFQLSKKRMLYQARAQAYGISFFYFGLLIWRLIEGKTSDFRIEFLLSISMFLLGIVWLYNTGKTLKWKT